MEPISTAVVIDLARKLAPHTIKAVKKVKGMLDEHQIRKELESALSDAAIAFRACVPKGAAIENLDGFFGGPVIEHECQAVLQGDEPNLDALEAAFREGGYSIKGFDHRRALQEFFIEFIESAGRKESFIEANIARLEDEGYKGRYLNQVIKKHEVLDFSGVPDAYDSRQVVKLEELFITLQTSHRIPVVDILPDEEDRPKLTHPERLPSDLRIRESIEIRSVVDALKRGERMMVLGAPGAGKTTFMKYLALTFARNQARKTLDLNEDRLPILIRLQDMAAALSEGAIADTLPKYLNRELQLDLPDDYFQPYLEAGRCIVLFDGLDEVADIRERGEVAKAVALFANLYRGNRYVITSRIAGYREIQGFLESDYPHFTIRDFDDAQMKDFARKWYQARYPLEASKRADDLIQVIERNPKVKQLATNPLMLTIVAIVHRSSAELPNERVKLYDRCRDALLYSWQRQHNRSPLTDVRGNLIRDTEVRRRLEQLAYWMHSESPQDSQGQMHVKYAHLKSKLAEQLIERKKVDGDEAEDEAKHFLKYIRQTTGVLLERGTELYAFVHLTFQEYFAAYDIYRQCGSDVEKVWREIAPYLHDSHWQEVIRLLVAKLNGEFDWIGEVLIRKILSAETPYEDLLKRNLLLAAACLADDVATEVETYQPILDKTVDMALGSPYDFQRDYAKGILKELANSHYKDGVMDKFVVLLSDADAGVRRSAALTLGWLGQASESVVGKLVDALDNADADVRQRAALTLGELGSASESVVSKLVDALDNADEGVRWRAASALGRLGSASESVVSKLVDALSDADADVRQRAASALGELGPASESVVSKLVDALDNADAGVRQRA
ncbi:HEAT repeat domain-containing protein, partial [Candidatus Poribacteria bacterium]|nr:HEAT repeat domain-containing protein [Candidatus Poribacteria bacterium]